MTPADHYKMYATIAAEMAADTADPRRRASLLEMAQAWQALADKEEGHVAQQQQQPQPKDKKE